MSNSGVFAGTLICTVHYLEVNPRACSMKKSLVNRIQRPSSDLQKEWDTLHKDELLWWECLTHMSSSFWLGQRNRFKFQRAILPSPSYQIWWHIINHRLSIIKFDMAKIGWCETCHKKVVGWYDWSGTVGTTVPTVPYQPYQPYQPYRTNCTNRTVLTCLWHVSHLS